VLELGSPFVGDGRNPRDLFDVMLSPSTQLRVCELIGFCRNEQAQLFDFVEAKFAELEFFQFFHNLSR
jgi:hypothetical protein